MRRSSPELWLDGDTWLHEGEDWVCEEWRWEGIGCAECNPTAAAIRNGWDDPVRMERDTLRRRVDAITEIVKHFAEDDGDDPIVGKVQELFDCHREATADYHSTYDALRTAVGALRAIEDVPTEWGEGVDANMERVRSLARTALATIGDAAKEPGND